MHCLLTTIVTLLQVQGILIEVTINDDDEYDMMMIEDSRDSWKKEKS